MKRKKSTTTSPYFDQVQGNRLNREIYNVPAVDLAKALLGKVLVRRLPQGDIVKGVIVETEAYPGEFDPASHSYGGKKTERNSAMFMDPGTSYVYFTYGMYHCFNVSSQEMGGAVLIRGFDPLEDYESLHELRNNPSNKKRQSSGPPKARKRLKIYQLANGPGKMCLALDIHRCTCDKLDLTTSDMIWIEVSSEDRFQPGNFEIEISKRVGIDSQPPEARDQLWRFFIVNNFAVSTAKPTHILKQLKQIEVSRDNATSSVT